MASSSNSRTSLKTIFPIFQFSIIIFFILLPFANPTTFNFPNFRSNQQKIVTQGDSVIKGDIIELTKNDFDGNLTFSVGRAIYAEPVRLWDSTSRKLADFTTNFTFVIKNVTQKRGADGFAFFLVPNGSDIPPNSAGHCLGLVSDSSKFSSVDNPVVAIEFDTFPNDFDPPFPDGADHVGIDINSISSVKAWRVDNVTRTLSNGSKGNAWITYDSTTHNLSVFLSFAENPVFNGNSILSYVLDLRNELPEWVTVGFSAATGLLMQLHQISSWEFNSTEFPSNNLTTLFSSNPRNETRKGGNENIGLIVGSTVGGSVLVGGMFLILFLWWRKRVMVKEEKEDTVIDDFSMDDEFEKGTGPRRFSYTELIRATNNFAEEGKLGQGGFGGVYRGEFSDLNLDVAVKRVSKGSEQGKKEYMSEVKTISRLRHRNLVQLIGWCHEQGEFLLVYEFMPNGSLDFHLFKGKSMLTWATRYKIALGLASALLYLHEEWEQCVVHRDVKSSNVMLDSSFNARLGDFGLARLVDHELGLQTTALAGTMGYLAPEYVTTGKASKEADVYSFGVVALEIACGRRAVEPKEEESKVGLVAWVWELYRSGKLLDAADEKLSMDFDDEQMERLLIVGLWCAHLDYNLRPSLRLAISVLTFEAPMPNLPSEMSMPRYIASSSFMHAPGFSYTSSNGATATFSEIYSSSTINSSQVTASPQFSDSSALLTQHPYTM